MLVADGLAALDRPRLRVLKRKGFSDLRLAALLGTDEHAIRHLRHTLGLRPVYKRVDSCAAAFATSTAYLYSTYEDECEAAPSDRRKEIGRASCRERVCQYVLISVVALS